MSRFELPQTFTTSRPPRTLLSAAREPKSRTSCPWDPSSPASTASGEAGSARQVRSVRHRALDVADVEQADLALVDGGERMGDERVEPGLVDLDVEHPASARGDGHRLDAVQRVLLPPLCSVV